MRRFLSAVVVGAVLFALVTKCAWSLATRSASFGAYSPKRDNVKVLNTTGCRVEMTLEGREWKRYDSDARGNENVAGGDVVEGETRKVVIEVGVELGATKSEDTVVSTVVADRESLEVVPVAAFVTSPDDQQSEKVYVPYGLATWSNTGVATRQRLVPAGTGETRIPARLNLAIATDHSRHHGYYKMKVPLAFKKRGDRISEVSCEHRVETWNPGEWVDGYKGDQFNSMAEAAHFYRKEFRAAEYRSVGAPALGAEESQGERPVAMGDLPSGGRLTVSKRSFRELVEGPQRNLPPGGRHESAGIGI